MSVASRTKFVQIEAMSNDDLVQFKLLLPAALKLRVEAEANANRRSLSQEIVVALQERFPEPLTDDRLAALALEAAIELTKMANDTSRTQSERDTALITLEKLRDDIRSGRAPAATMREYIENVQNKIAQ